MRPSDTFLLGLSWSYFTTRKRMWIASEVWITSIISGEICLLSRRYLFRLRTTLWLQITVPSGE